jgi:hypothetical protein
MENNNYSKNVWLRRSTEMLLAESRAKFILDNKDKKPTDDNVIKEALGVYVNGFTKIQKRKN